MRDSGRLAAAIAILDDFGRRRVPLKTAIADWARGARYAGAKDRAWIAGLCLDVLRRRRSLAAAMGGDSARAAVLAALRFLWKRSLEDIAALAAEEPHGPGVLADQELSALNQESPLTPAKAGAQARNVPLSILGDFPEWLEPSVRRVFGGSAIAEMSALAARADVDLRLNTLKAHPDKALAALKSVGAVVHPFLKTAARILAPDPSRRAPAVTIIPAFNKGWVEVQDLGSQIAAAAAGAIRSAQVLDYCAGGGGKTLALGALMENTGQLYAHDANARRIAPLYERAKRAGVRNLQIVNPETDQAALAALAGKMDVVFVDAPCSGSGAWRRHPDTKWRLTPQQLERRIAEQDCILAEASRFVKPGGRLVYVTCSIFVEENEDRIAQFLAARGEFEQTSALDAVAASGLPTKIGRAALEQCQIPEGALRITPARIGADGFFIAVLRRSA